MSADSTRAKTPEVVDAVTLLNTDFPDEPAIISGGIVHRETLSVVGGAPKVGKSNLLLNAAICRATGRPWLGFETTPGRTLYIQAEIPAKMLKGRLETLLREEGIELPPGQLFTISTKRLRLDDIAGRAQLRRWIKETGADWVIIDPLARFYRGDENSAKEMGDFIEGLAAISEDLGVAFTIVHHTAKPSDNGRQGGQRLRGSSALFGAADAAITLQHSAKTKERFHLGFELRLAEEPKPMILNRTPELWYHLVDPTKPAEGTDLARAQLLDVVADIRAGAITWTLLLEHQKKRAPKVKTSTLESRLHRTLERGQQSGRLRKDGGEWVVLDQAGA